MKLITFLGANKYSPVRYSLDGKISELTPFVQEAIIELYKNKFKDGCVVVLLTKTSKIKNWLSKKDSEEAYQETGLCERLENLSSKYGLNLSIREIEILEKCREENLWAIFEKITESINEKDEIIFDITHSFRYIPVFALSALYYSNIAKGAKVEAILYGAFEYGKNEDTAENRRIVPLFDLTLSVRVLEWSVAINRFLDTGDVSLLKELSSEKLLPIRKETKGAKGAKLNKFINSLEKFSKDAQTCRAPEFEKDIKKILELLPEAKKEVNIVKPLEPLMERMQEEFSELKNGNINLNVAEWCLRKGLVQQGLTILREELVNYVFLKRYPGEDITHREYRKNVEDLLNAEGPLDLEIEKELKKLWDELCEYRNNINHAGWSQNVHEPQDFKDKLANFISRAKKIMQN